ncbi:hypothetical protein AV530_005467 [Patagioenas fasciata monilis]|uniref:Uncharacterized protein n=1 Tax=Patagioenas fasciata monilis TaxID=372326 RepID=A0A1V4JLX5_PATFA|nr:hypothetical protein AV530_005467 [Patagioenas fasciata monilis]
MDVADRRNRHQASSIEMNLPLIACHFPRDLKTRDFCRSRRHVKTSSYSEQQGKHGSLEEHEKQNITS